MSLTVLHVALGLTANSKPPLFPALPAVPGESSLTAWQVEQLNTESTEGAALEVKECVDIISKKGRQYLAELGDIKLNIKIILYLCSTNLNLAILQIKFVFKYVD